LSGDWALQKAQRPSGNPDEEDDTPIGLSTRASPLLDMLGNAKQEGGQVMWRPE